MDESDFLKTDGKFIKNHSGIGSIVNLRGTNLGGWLLQEDWMGTLGVAGLEREGWVVSASLNADNAEAAIDGDTSTTWSSGANKSNGQWFQIDMGTKHLFNKISIDAASCIGGYPSAYQIMVSDDGTAWEDVASGTSDEENTVIRFSSQVARYIKVIQAGSSADWWSIAEINIYSEPVYGMENWTATASSSAVGTTPGNAFDGEQSTCWSNGTAQADGQWYQIDMGKVQPVKGLLLDSGASAPMDYPRGYRVQVSKDGADWTTVLNEYGASRITYMAIGGYDARYLKIVQTENAASNWWSIAELSIYTDGAFDREGWLATASQSGTLASNGLDGDTATGWSSGAPQTKGQWYQIDMGATHTFNQIVMDSGTQSSNDYAREYEILVSVDGSNWIQVAKGYGTRQVIPVNFPSVGARYIKIIQTGISSYYWTISELNVYLHVDEYSVRQKLSERFGNDTANNLFESFQDSYIQEEDLDHLAGMGINAVRVPIYWLELMNQDGTWKANPWTHLDWIVNEARERGIYVIIDLHGVPGGLNGYPTSGQTNANELWTDPWCQNKTVEIWKGIAGRYEGNSTIAAYDLLNEPVSSDSSIATANLYDTLYNEVRSIDPDHIIIINAFWDFSLIVPPSTFGWENVVYETHHYAAANNGRDTIDWNAQNNYIDYSLQNLAYYQKEWNVPIFAGEYSFWAFEDLWAKWMNGLNALNISWSNWSYKNTLGSEGWEPNKFWAFFHSNSHQGPDINNDNVDTIRSKWNAFATTDYKPNKRLINLIKLFAKDGSSVINQYALNRSNWSALASSTEAGGSPSNMLDGNYGTRWATGGLQTNGQWIQINMGKKQLFNKISLECGQTVYDEDYPKEYQVQVSGDASNWVTVASGSGFGYKMVIPFEKQYAQYIRVMQTGTKKYWWSVLELNAYCEPELNRSGWEASASSVESGGSVNNALDGNINTRWSTGIAQAGGQWYQIDMKQSQTIDGIFINTGEDTEDYPREYRVEVSNNGIDWLSVAEGEGDSAAIVIDFPVQNARYLRIKQTGSAANWWSIAELTVFGEAMMGSSGWSASASHTSLDSTPNNVLDGNINTRWTSGASQIAGQWFQIDLGSNQTFNQLELDVGTELNDFIRGYIIYVSTDLSNWETIATGLGDGSILRCNFPATNARYIKIIQTGEANNWWSIAELRLYQ